MEKLASNELESKINEIMEGNNAKYKKEVSQ